MIKLIKTLAILLFFLQNSSFSKVITPKNHSKSPSKREFIIMNELWKSVYEEPLNVNPNQLRPNLTKKKVDTIVKKDVTKKTDDKLIPEKKIKQKEKKQSKNNYVQEQLRKNRNKIKQLHKIEKEKDSKLARTDQSSKESVNNFLTEMKKDQLGSLKTYSQDSKSSWKSWKNEVNQTLQKWRKERDHFLKRIDVYKNGLADLGSGNPLFQKNKKKIFKASSSQLEKNKSYGTKLKYNFHVVDQAFNINVRDQGPCSTCSAFAGAQAIEILLRQNGYSTNLSPQYLYWASKSDCQQAPCVKKGSWIGYGLNFSIKQLSLDIPSENNCPYNQSLMNGNETQIPLSPNCHQGIVKVEKYRYLHTIDEIIMALKNNQAVIGGFKLSSNFYNTDGFLLEGVETGLSDQHAKGHAFLVIGLMELPKGEKRIKGGKHCFIMVNSWGEGYGKGGHACLSESWIRKYKISNPFVVIDSVRVN